MNPWKSLPLIRLSLPFAGGVICALMQPGGQRERILWLAGGSAVLITGRALLLLKKNPPYRIRWIPGCIIFLLMVVSGGLTVFTYRANQHGIGGSQRIFPVEIREPPSHSANSVKLIAARYEPEMNSRALTRNGLVVLFLEKDSAALALRYGDWILVSSTMRALRHESNPYGFDPAGFYGRKGIESQGWVASSDWRLVPIQSSNPVKRTALGVRERLLDILKENHLNGDELAVASAILLGYTGDIGSDLRKGFAASGAMHILAVSGMHVGVIFLFIETMLAFLSRKKYGKPLKAILTIGLIWCYAMVTGLSPPVFRASLMISLIILGRNLKRKPDSLNVVAGALMILLMADPSLLLHTGFQFSFLAVFGILILYKPLVAAIPFNGWILKRLWGLMAVSLAAQITTFPMALYAFHQFPNYFLLTNLLVLPLTSLIIYTGIGVLALSPFQVISSLLAKLLSFIVLSLNVTVQWIEGLPGSVSGGWYLSWLDVFLLYGVIITIFCFLFFRRTAWLFSLMTLLIIWSTMGLINEYLRSERTKIVVFHCKGASQYAFIHGRKAVCLKDFRAACGPAYARDALSQLIRAEGVNSLQTAYLIPGDLPVDSARQMAGFFFRQGGFLQCTGWRVVVLSGRLPPGLSGGPDADLVILRGIPEVAVETIIRCFHPGKIIFDPTNSWAGIRRWKEEAETLGVSCYCVAEEGAFVMDLTGRN